MTKLTAHQKIKTPNAAVLVWTYKNRLSHEESDVSDVHETQETILSTMSLVSIKTSKAKGEAAGKFQLVLAPLKNWVGFITPGSWCAILMTQDVIGDITKESYIAKPNELKMFGRINSIRVSSQVDGDGVRRTVYLAEGEDWGCAFNSILYVDIAARNKNDSPVGTARAYTMKSYLKRVLDTDNKIPTTTHNVNTLIELWGKQNDTISELQNVLGSANSDVTISSLHEDSVFRIPTAAMKFIGAENNLMANLIKQKSGKLTAYDTYEDANAMESAGLIDPGSVFGSHRLWDIVNDAANKVVNEVFTEMRWEEDKPQLCIYKRIKPFITSETSVGSSVADSVKRALSNPTSIGSMISRGSLVSLAASGGNAADQVTSRLQDVKRIDVALEDIISIDAGTNWKDKLNFVEIQPDTSFLEFNGMQTPIGTVLKSNAQVVDKAAFSREGMKAACFKTKFFPINDNKDLDYTLITAWKDVLARWYFNTHNFLNGTLEFMGQNEYIGVGDNIMIDAAVLGPTPNLSSTMLQRQQTNLLLHVENVSHDFVFGENNTRHWVTTVQFVRGVTCDEKGVPLDIGALDQDTSNTTPAQERNTANTVNTSGSRDPDVQKVRGT